MAKASGRCGRSCRRRSNARERGYPDLTRLMPCGKFHPRCATDGRSTRPGERRLPHLRAPLQIETLIERRETAWGVEFDSLKGLW